MTIKHEIMELMHQSKIINEHRLQMIAELKGLEIYNENLKKDIAKLEIKIALRELEESK